MTRWEQNLGHSCNLVMNCSRAFFPKVNILYAGGFERASKMYLRAILKVTDETS